MTVSTSGGIKICPDCGADCGAAAASCWMCQADLQAVEPIVQAELVPGGTGRKPNALSEWFFAASTIVLMLVAGLVGVGLLIDEPGLGIGYAIVVAPAMIATLVRVRMRKLESGNVSWAERFVTLIVSGALTISILSLIAAAGLIGLFIYCLIEIT